MQASLELSPFLTEQVSTQNAVAQRAGLPALSFSWLVCRQACWSCGLQTGVTLARSPHSEPAQWPLPCR